MCYYFFSSNVCVFRHLLDAENDVAAEADIMSRKGH